MIDKQFTDMHVVLVHTPFNWKRPLTILSWLIRVVCNTYWNHAAILVDIDGVLFIVESDIKGVVMLPYKNWVKNQEIMLLPLLRSSHRRNKLFSKVGNVGYSFSDLLWFMPINIFFKKWYGRTTDSSTNKPTCYELCAWLLNNGGEFKEWYKISPNEFYNEIIKSKTIKGECTILKAKELV